MSTKKTQKKKETPKKKYVRKKKNTATYNNEIIGVLLFALGVLLFLSIYFKGSVGLFGIYVRSLFIGLLGVPAFVLPPAVLVYSILVLFRKDDHTLNLRMAYLLVLLVLISSLVQTAFYSAERLENKSFLRCIIDFFNQEDVLLNGGGVLGGLVSTPLIKVFQVLGTIIILTALCVIDTILLTNISIANFIRNLKSLFDSKLKERKLEVLEGGKGREPKIQDENGPSLTGDTDNLDLDFKAKPKAVDSRMQKTLQELKEKTKSAASPAEETPSSEYAHLDMVLKDFGKTDPEKKDPEKKEHTKPEKPGAVEKRTSSSVQADTGELIIQNTATPNYRFPSIELLGKIEDEGRDTKAIKNSTMESAKKLEDTLKSFSVEARVINVSRGPSVTRYELQPSAGVKVSRIVNLSDDIALNLAAPGIRIEAPIPGKAAIGIEVPNREVTPVVLREVLESREFLQYPSKLAFSVGKDISGECIVSDIARMPHMLIAGSTGSGKSVCINNIIISLLYKASPDEVKLLMVDPKVVELGNYNGIPHLLIPVVTDPKKAAGALNWAVQEMVNRYRLFADKGVRDLKGYNEMLAESGEGSALPQIVIIIDELADLMMAAPNEVEDAICRLAQMARAAGMHLVIATQRPSVDVITGVIKANIPSRLAFAVASQVDSRTILDMGGAEKLLGKGDMLFYPAGKPKPVRVQGAFVSDKEIERVIEFVKSQGESEYNQDILEEINAENVPEESEAGDNDELLPRAIEMVVEAGQASVSLVQRRFKVGYARAARIVDQMEARGIVGGFEGSKPRQVLISRQQWQEMQMNQEA